MRRIIASVDLGSNSIKIVVGEIRGRKINIIAASDTPSKGIKKGVIVNQNSLIESLKLSFKKTEELIGIKVTKVIVNVPARSANFVIGEGTTTINREDKSILPKDIIRALQGSVYNRIPDDMELVAVIPVKFYVNNEPVLHPRRMIGNKLDVKTVVVSADKTDICTTLNCFDKIGVEVIDIVFGSIGDYHLFKNEQTDKKVGALVNVGDQTTTVSIFNKGVITNTEVIELGGNSIDNDIGFIYKLNRSDSRFLKENLSLAHNRMAQGSASETITNKLGDVIHVNQYEISTITMSRLEEILKLVKKQINLLTKKEISYIIFTGGVTESSDFTIILEELYGKNISLGTIPILGVRNNKYSSAIGMIKYYNDKLKLRNKKFSIFNYEELEELSTPNSKKINISNDSIVGKIFGYFFDN